jgi:hypothetical protein
MKKVILVLLTTMIMIASFGQANLTDAYHVRARTKLQLGAITITGFSSDGTMTANSDALLPTQKAVRTYVNSIAGGLCANGKDNHN